MLAVFQLYANVSAPLQKGGRVATDALPLGPEGHGWKPKLFDLFGHGLPVRRCVTIELIFGA